VLGRSHRSEFLYEKQKDKVVLVVVDFALPGKQRQLAWSLLSLSPIGYGG
jgi:hypothetical protein